MARCAECPGIICYDVENGMRDMIGAVGTTPYCSVPNVPGEVDSCPLREDNGLGAATEFTQFVEISTRQARKEVEDLRPMAVARIIFGIVN